MGYMHIENLYKNQDILLFKKCYAMEKVHGSSAHVGFLSGDGRIDPSLQFFSGGESPSSFEAIFNKTELLEKFKALARPDVVVYGEVYGGRCQGMKDTYGPELKFIAFDVLIGENWLSVPDANQVASSLGLEFVPFSEISTDLAELDKVRDMPSEVAVRRGMGADKQREGVVLRPLIEVTKNNGQRVICKHKTEKFNERATPQKVVDPAKLKVLEEATAIAQEWVTDMRLQHVLQKMPEATDMKFIPGVIKAMIEDIYREAKGEVVESKEATAAIGKRTVELFKEWVKNSALKKE